MKNSTDSPESPVHNYHTGFMTHNPAMVRAALGESFFMANGRFSGEPVDWQVHMYLSG